MDQPTEVVQPEGQGDAGHADAPYAEYLNRIPEEVRGDVEPIFKEWDANTTRRFQEHAEYRRQWEPYEQAGIQDLTADDIEWYRQFRDAAQQNPAAIRDWYEQFAQANGLTPEEAAAQAQDQGAYDGDLFAPDTQQLEQLLQKQLTPLQEQITQMSEWRQQQEYQSRLADAERFVEGQITELEQKHPDQFNRDAIEKFVVQYIDSDPQNAVQRAFDDYQALVGQIEKATLQSKASQPAPAEGGGMAAAAPEEIKTLAQAGQIALQRLRAST